MKIDCQTAVREFLYFSLEALPIFKFDIKYFSRKSGQFCEKIRWDQYNKNKANCCLCAQVLSIAFVFEFQIKFTVFVVFCFVLFRFVISF